MLINECQLWQLHKEKRELRKSYLDHWEATVSQTGTGRPVDAIISPAVAYTAVPHGHNSYVEDHTASALSEFLVVPQ